MRPDTGRLGPTHTAAIDDTLINLVSVSLKRYPDALLAQYSRVDLAVLLPHRSLKEAESLTQQLLGALPNLPDLAATYRANLLHIGVSAYRPRPEGGGGDGKRRTCRTRGETAGGNGWPDSVCTLTVHRVEMTLVSTDYIGLCRFGYQPASRWYAISTGVSRISCS